MLTEKLCKRCGKLKQASEFHRRSGRPNGLQAACKECKRIQREKDPNTKSRAHSYYEKNKERILKNCALWLAKNKERKAVSTRAWQQANSERLKAKRSLMTLERKRYDADYYAANAVRRRAQRDAWAVENKDRIYALNRNRRAKIKGCSGTHTAADIQKIKVLQKGRCAHSWCKSALEHTNTHIDHVIPLALGGSNDRGNIQLLCVRCNLAKNAIHPVDFAQMNGMLL